MKMTIQYYLKDKKTNNETMIILSASYKGKRLRYSTGIKVLPKQWSNKNKNIYSIGKQAKYNNELLKEYKTVLETEYNKQIRIGQIQEPEYFRVFLDRKFKAKYKLSESDLFMFYDEFLQMYENNYRM